MQLACPLGLGGRGGRLARSFRQSRMGCRIRQILQGTSIFQIAICAEVQREAPRTEQLAAFSGGRAARIGGHFGVALRRPIAKAKDCVAGHNGNWLLKHMPNVRSKEAAAVAGIGIN